MSEFAAVKYKRFTYSETYTYIPISETIVENERVSDRRTGTKRPERKRESRDD